MEYEDRIVVFLDVLGFSNFTNYTGTTQINQDKKVENVNKYLEMLHGSRGPWLGEAAPQPECCSVCAQKAPASPGLPWSCPPA